MTTDPSTSSTDSFRIGERMVGGDAPCFVVAEAGVNHNGDVGRAHDLIDIAAECRADAVKFQTFEPEALASPTAPSAPYQRERGAANQVEMLRELTLPRSAWRELAEHARERGLNFLSTAFDDESLQLILEVGVLALKSPSGEITNLGFLQRLADTNLPLVISTGGGTLPEVRAAVEATSSAPAICLLHCVTSYPAPVEQSNLRAIQTLQSTFNVPVGWSDHTSGYLSAVAAVALGASVLEKHFTLDRTLPGPDHHASADPEMLREYVEAIRATETALGDGEKKPTAAEQENLELVRRSFHARRDLAVGKELKPDDVALVRPATGLSPTQSVVGRTVARSVSAGDPITAEDIQ